MDEQNKFKQITKLFESCNECGLSIAKCLCTKNSQVTSAAKFWILSTESEFYRPSNTAKVLKQINPDSTEIFQWQRTKGPEQLIRKIKEKEYSPFVLFPAQNEEQAMRRVEYKPTGKTPAFIILDGTWKEARRILRKSDYLSDLPIISLKPAQASRYDLRRGAAEGNLCTIEAAIELLKMNSEYYTAQIIDDYFLLFMKRYKAGMINFDVR